MAACADSVRWVPPAPPLLGERWRRRGDRNGSGPVAFAVLSAYRSCADVEIRRAKRQRLGDAQASTEHDCDEASRTNAAQPVPTCPDSRSRSVERPRRARYRVMGGSRSRDHWNRIRAFIAAEVGPGVREFALNLGRYDLLTTASALAFRVLFALIPLAAACLALLGVVHLGDLWQDWLVPRLRDRVTAPQFEVIDTAARSILGRGTEFWLTFGLALAVWEVSGAVRGAMGALNRIYGRDDTRPFWSRMAISIGLALVVSIAFVVAIGALSLGDELADQIGSDGWADALAMILRIGVASLAALVGVVFMIRWGTSKRHTVRWLGFVSGLVVVLWIVATFILTWYFRSLADYRSVFGAVTSFIVLLIYLYWISILLLAGALADSMLRERLAVPLEERRALPSHASR
jgi:membrane protein